MPQPKVIGLCQMGRVFKNESLADAFSRISHTELGQEFDYLSTKNLGLYYHLYDDSVFDDDISTHYINAPCLIQLPNSMALNLPMEQNQEHLWVNIGNL
ncbi:MAG: colanic acid biosynthesis protein WcaH [Marinomonas primoryensis]|jgi:colanic acid biosynthesis protein WcaH